MDPLIATAARALAAGDPLGALRRVALRRDAEALALRGIAIAQLGDFARARTLIRRATRSFAPRAAVARARCTVIEAEIALVSHDLNFPVKALDAARETLDSHEDRANAAYARYLQTRRLLLTGRIDEAERALAKLDATVLTPPLKTFRELMIAGIAIRRVQTKAARAALARARRAARGADIPALTAEVERISLELNTPAARLIANGGERLILIEDAEALFNSKALVVDACSHVVREHGALVSLATRPVLFALLRALGEAWPEDVSRDALLARASGSKMTDESHRARLRVEVGRLRTALRTIADVIATKRGFAIAPRRAREVVVLAPPIEGERAALLALLADGESWSSSALALALGSSQRTVQRTLDSLETAGKVKSAGRGRARRWMMPPVAGFTTTLLLPSVPLID
jgi:DNA-binding transcriptional ArsR family regulator